MRSAPPGASPATTRPSATHQLARAWHPWALSVTMLGVLVVAGCGTTHHTAAVTVPTATHLSVTLTTDFATYSASQAIGVTVTNAGKQVLYAVDNHSECTILRLQELVGGAWSDVMPCTTGQPVNVLEVAPGPGIPYTLAPGNAHANPNAWDPGVYRVVLLLGTKSDGSNLTTTIYSAGFQVKAPT